MLRAMHRAALLLCVLILSVTAGAYSSSSPADVSTAQRSASQHVVGAHSPNPRRRKRSNSSLGRSSNWAGVGLSASPGTYTSVTGTFTVTTPAISAQGGNQPQSASVWVGIDGNTCKSAIFQTGLQMDVDVDGNVVYQAWYEWFPDPAQNFTGITFKSGDAVVLTVTATSATDASAVIENKSSGNTVSKALSSSSELCLQDAEWVVEDFDESDGLMPFANFGTITFTNASADTANGRVGPNSGAQILVVDTGNETLTRTLVDGSSIQIQYAVSDDPSTTTTSAASSSISAPSMLSRSSPSSTASHTSPASSPASSASPSPSPSPSSSHSAVIGGILGGVLAGVLIGTCLFLFLRRREHRRRKQEAHPTLLVPAPPITETATHGPKSTLIGNGLPVSSRPDAAMAEAAHHGEEDQDQGGSARLAPPQMNDRPVPGDRRSWITESTQDPRGRPPMYFPPPPEYQAQ